VLSLNVRHASLISIYALLITVLYMHGFWSSFKINFLEFMGFMELVERTVYIIITTSTFLIVSAFFVSYFIRPEELGPSLSNNSKELHHRLNRIEYYFVITTGFTGLLIFTMSAFYTGSQDRWAALGGLVAALLSRKVLALSEALGLLSFISNFKLRVTITFIALMILAGSYGYGVRDANLHKQNIIEVTVHSDVVEYGYLGKLDDYLFFWNDSTSEVVVVAAQSVNEIRYKLTEHNQFKSFIDEHTSIFK